VLDPHLPDGPHASCDGRRFVKDGDRLYLEGTDTLAGRCARPLFSPVPLLAPLNRPRGQRGDARQVRAQLLALHRLSARSRAPLSQARKQERHAAPKDVKRT
jgi:hypothetical protein